MLERQSTARERDTVTATKLCLNAYYPNDTDYAAAVVRQKFCGCFALELIEAAAKDEELAGQLATYGSSGRTPSVAVTNRVSSLQTIAPEGFEWASVRQRCRSDGRQKACLPAA